MDSAREIYAAAEKRWLAHPSGSYAALCGILIAVMAQEHPELLIEASKQMDEIGSVDRILAKYLGSAS